MRIEIESTNKVTSIDGVPVRLWKGWTESGIPCAVFVHRVAVLHENDSSEFETELQEQQQPSQMIPFDAAMEEWREQLPHIPYRGEDEHPEDYDGPCACDSCLQDGLR